jgi:Domain of unknown function (DUF1772).
MNSSIESLLRFINLTASGLLAGSLGFGGAPLVPGWKQELPREHMPMLEHLKSLDYFNAIGPVALGSAVTLAVAARRPTGYLRALDAAAAVSLAGVLAATVMGTVPINRQLDAKAPTDYANDHSQSLARTWSRAHAVRTTLGVTAFLIAVASNLAPRVARTPA